MKKLLGIVVLSLLWCNISNADVVTYKCTGNEIPKINWQMDRDAKIVKANWIWSGQEGSETYKILSIDNEKVKLKASSEKPFYWYYGTDFRTDNGDGYIQRYNCIIQGQQINTSTASKVEIASMIDKAKNTCKELGFAPGTEKFADCSLKLYSQSVELAAEQNKTVVMQPQSSGSNKVIIYDPVRDSNALMQKGQTMLSGACTLGIDC